MFWKRFTELCNLKNTKPNPVAKELGISSGIITKWKNGSLPNSDTLLKIADYFEISVDYLLGRDEYTTNNISNTGTNNGTQANIINTDCSLDTFNNPAVSKAYKGLTERDKLAVQMFILDTAAASEKSNAKVEVIERKE
ncbi:MAG: helix-turn-helix domain-containing protein [Oscillospiraceae bacterium]|nr:helix-turn-helix domain-containing protein [Oscillospiraceae bacterium]